MNFAARFLIDKFLLGLASPAVGGHFKESRRLWRRQSRLCRDPSFQILLLGFMN